MLTFEQYLQDRDPDLYNEISMSDMAKLPGKAWKGAGELMGRGTRNLTAGALLGGAALGLGGGMGAFNRHHTPIHPVAQQIAQQDDDSVDDYEDSEDSEEQGGGSQYSGRPQRGQSAKEFLRGKGLAGKVLAIANPFSTYHKKKRAGF
jgi:hypothetical protein